MVQALTTLGGLIGNQSRRERLPSPALQSSTDAIAMAKDKKTAKLALQNAREERLYHIMSNDQVLAFGLTFAGVAAAQLIPFSKNKLINESVQATMTSTSILMGMGYAGVGDLTTALVASAGALASLVGNIQLPSIPSANDILNHIPVVGDIPLVNNADVREFGLRSALGSIPIIGSLSPILNLIKW